jgi:hypothetical protein
MLPFAFHVMLLDPDGSDVIIASVSTAPVTPDRTLMVDEPFCAMLPVV